MALSFAFLLRSNIADLYAFKFMHSPFMKFKKRRALGDTYLISIYDAIVLGRIQRGATFVKLV